MEMARVLLISGSLRAGSTNSAVLRTVADLELEDIERIAYDGLGELQHFNPDDDPSGGTPPPVVVELRSALAATDAVLFCTPEYAGALPGSFKNLLDWTVGRGETYGKPVAWINVSGRAAPTGGSGAHAELQKVLGYTGSEIVEAACVRIPVTRDAVGEDGLVADPAIREQLGEAVRALAGWRQSP